MNESYQNVLERLKEERTGKNGRRSRYAGS